jgi:predicted nucleotidyltransferase component of viral defense system
LEHSDETDPFNRPPRREEPVIIFDRSTPAGAITLAKLTLSDREVTLVDLSPRQLSGLKLPSPSGRLSLSYLAHFQAPGFQAPDEGPLETAAFTGSLSVTGNLSVAGSATIADLRITKPQDFRLDLQGAASGSSEGPTNDIKIDGISVITDALRQRGLNTVIIKPDGTVRNSQRYDVHIQPDDWNTWATWIADTAVEGDAIAVTSNDAISPVPPGGTAETLLRSVGATLAFTLGSIQSVFTRIPYALLFIRGQQYGMKEVLMPYQGGNAKITTEYREIARKVAFPGAITTKQLEAEKVNVIGNLTVTGSLTIGSSPDSLDVATSLRAKADQSALDTVSQALSHKADQSALDTINQALNNKANRSDLDAVNQALSHKADQSALDTVNQALSNKANRSDLDAVNQALSHKVDQSALDTVNQALSNKANRSDLDAVNQALSHKADQSALDGINQTLNNKANRSDLDSLSHSLVNKVDQSTLDGINQTLSHKVDQSALDGINQALINKANKAGSLTQDFEAQRLTVTSLDIQSVNRTNPANHSTAVKGLYIRGDFGPDSGEIEFRHSNGTQGIGFGYNTIYATGSNPNQDLSLNPRGAGKVTINGSSRLGAATNYGSDTVLSVAPGMVQFDAPGVPGGRLAIDGTTGKVSIGGDLQVTGSLLIRIKPGVLIKAEVMIPDETRDADKFARWLAALWDAPETAQTLPAHTSRNDGRAYNLKDLTYQKQAQEYVAAGSQKATKYLMNNNGQVVVGWLLWWRANDGVSGFPGAGAFEVRYPPSSWWVPGIIDVGWKVV